MALLATTNRTTTVIKTPATTRAPSTGGSQSYLAVAIALPLTLAAVVIAMGLLRWKMRSAAARRSSTYLDRRCQKNSKAPPPYADAQQLESAPPSAVAVVGRKLSARLSVTLPRLPRAPDLRRLPAGFWTVSRALSNGSGGLTASTSLPCLCPEDEASVADLRTYAASSAGCDGNPSVKCTESGAAAPPAALLPCTGLTFASEQQVQTLPSAVPAALPASSGFGCCDEHASGRPADDDEGGATIATRARPVSSVIDRIDEERDGEYDVVGELSLPQAAGLRERGSAIGAPFFPLCFSMPEISLAAIAADEVEDVGDERLEETSSDGERVSRGRRRSSAAATAAEASDVDSVAARSPLGLAFHSTPIFMDDIGLEPLP